MKKLLILICVLSAVNLIAQNTPHADSIRKKDAIQNNPVVKIEIPDKKEEIFTFVEQMPTFAGESLRAFVARNIKYPQKEKGAGIGGTVYVTFVIDSSGNVTDPKIMRGIIGGSGLDNEALRIVKMMPPWHPGKQNNKPVSVQYVLPVKF